MRVSYDGQGDTLSILVGRGRIMRAEEHGRVVANFDGKGRLLEIEIVESVA